MDRFESHLGCNYDPAHIAALSDEELAAKIRDSEGWDIDLLRDLVWRADDGENSLGDEWEAADDKEFEAVAFKAAGILGVEIL